jgi:hypothetical protein
MTDQFRGVGLDESFDVERFRSELRKMSDEDLVKCGKQVASIRGPLPRHTPQKDVWSIQLDEARAEWRRRHPAKSA